jgi:hypothetical protein
MFYYATAIDKIKRYKHTIYLKIQILLTHVIGVQKLIIPKEYDLQPIDITQTHTPQLFHMESHKLL